MRGVAMRTTLSVLEKSLQPEGRSSSTLRAPGSGCELHLRLPSLAPSASICSLWIVLLQHLSNSHQQFQTLLRSPVSGFLSEDRAEADAAQDIFVCSAENPLRFVADF